MSDENLTNGAQPSDEVGSEPHSGFSWLDPHPIFVIVLVGSGEQPFGIQKDFLCAKSAYYREYFLGNNKADAIEHIVKLPDTAAEVFAYAQHYIYTSQVFPNLDSLPSYEVLIGLWKLGHELAIDGLCDATLEAMTECRRVTQHIPATPLLVQVWKDAPKGSSIRKLLLSWAAEYMRSSESRAEFAQSLPQEVLSELVIAMSSLESTPSSVDKTPSPALPHRAKEKNLDQQTSPSQQKQGPQSQQHKQQQSQPQQQQRNVHYIEEEDGDDRQAHPAKRARHSDGALNGGSATTTTNGRSSARKASSRSSLPGSRPTAKRRSNAASASDYQFTTPQKLNFCADLLTRMLSGPGFWTRLVGPFREPVDPQQDGVPDYFQRISKPMDLGTMKEKMDRKDYTSEEEFLADMNQIFDNCYTYWTRKDPMWGACEKLQKTFEEKYSQMHKWISKMEGDEGS